MNINKLLPKISILSIFISSALYAQGHPVMLKPVTVTANKIEENILEVPQSITVIDGEIIKEKGITNIQGIIDEIPNMSSLNFGEKTLINFRGLNTSLFTYNNPVVIYVNGIPLINKQFTNVSLANVEKVEVLRGPQSTLYGKDAIGGVINIITKEATNEVSGNVGLEYASYNTITANLNINAPLIKDKLFIGASGEFLKSDGWVTNHLTHDDKFGDNKENKYSAYILYKPTDELSTKFSVSRFELKKGWPGFLTFSPEVSLDEFTREKAKNAYVDIPTFEDSIINLYSLNINYNLDGLQLSSITTHKKVNFDAEYDMDFGQNMMPGSVTFDHNNLKEWAQEFRISNKTDKLKWIAGLYFDKQKFKHDPYGMEMPMGPGQVFLNNTKSTKNSKTQALFGQIDFSATEKLNITLGGRYQKITKDIIAEGRNYLNGNLFEMPGMAESIDFNAKKTWHSFLPKFALSYKYNDHLIPFISVSKGYMPGGFNFFPTKDDENLNRFGPQTSINYEIGLKGIYDNVMFSASAFRMDIKDIHVYETISKNVVKTANAGKAHSQGIEFEVTYFPVDEFEISGSLGLIDAKYDNYKSRSGVVYDGERIENTPQYTANLSLAYHNPKGFYGRLDTKLLGKTSFFSGSAKKFQKRQRSFTADIKLGYKYNDINVYGYVKNITNEDRVDNYYASSVATATFNAPRTFGIGLRYEF